MQIPADTIALRKLIVRDPGTQSMSVANLEALGALLPRLRASGQFWLAVGCVPSSQRGYFRVPILSELRALKPTPGQPVDREFRRAFYTAKGMSDPEVARIALEFLPLVAVYRFPSTPPPPGWPRADAEGLERLDHGDQGSLASTVVEIGDRETGAKFRAMLKTAEPDTQRTLIWALGRSRELEDFEFLAKLRGTLAKPEAEDTLVRSMNRIAQNMEGASKYPSAIREDRDRNIQELARNAAACKARLTADGLIVELTFYD